MAADLVVAKGLTSGYAPLGAVLLRGDIGEMLGGGDSYPCHGDTYSGHSTAYAGRRGAGASGGTSIYSSVPRRRVLHDAQAVNLRALMNPAGRADRAWSRFPPGRTVSLSRIPLCRMRDRCLPARRSGRGSRRVA